MHSWSPTDVLALGCWAGCSIVVLVLALGCSIFLMVTAGIAQLVRWNSVWLCVVWCCLFIYFYWNMGTSLGFWITLGSLIGGCGCSVMGELEMHRIWDEVGETESERDKLLLQLEQECLDAYKRKVDEASKLKAHLHLQLAEFDTELENVASDLVERSFFNRVDRPTDTLRDQLAAISLALVEMRQKKKERVAQFWDVQEQINKISGELSGNNMRDDTRKTLLLMNETYQ
jgi:hypothetical protein